MKLLFAAIVSVILQLSTAIACGVEDDTHQYLFFKNPAHRIITLAPHLAELVAAAGAGDYLVGVSSYSDYPEFVKSLPQVVDYQRIDVEKILRLKPDVVIAWGSDSGNPQLQQLRDFGIAVYYNRVDRVADIGVFIRKIGCIAHTASTANRAADRFDKELLSIVKTFSTKPTLSVFFELNEVPLMTLTKRSFINQAITLCGGNNIYADLPGVSPQVNPEAVIIANPDVFISTEPGLAWQREWQRWPQLSAVKVANFFTIDTDLLARPTPRLLQGITTLCAALDIARARAKR